jgi:hypothetical protein
MIALLDLHHPPRKNLVLQSLVFSLAQLPFLTGEETHLLLMKHLDLLSQIATILARNQTAPMVDRRITTESAMIGFMILLSIHSSQKHEIFHNSKLKNNFKPHCGEDPATANSRCSPSNPTIATLNSQPREMVPKDQVLSKED